MAIAYFIPDQAKLLARTASNGQQNTQQATNSAAAATSNGTPPRPPRPPRPTHPPHPHPRQRARPSSHFRANISVPLPRQEGAMSMSSSNSSGNSSNQQSTELGCWDLLAQIFCYALRLYSYNSTQRTPTVIQISFEISLDEPQSSDSSAGSANPADGAGDVTDAARQK